MNLIAAVDMNWAIGNNNGLLVKIPEDQKFFKNKTIGNVVVMGRKTLESFPNGLPLKNRTNIVLTHDKSYQIKDVIIVHSINELDKELEKYNSNDIYIIGGGSIYQQFLNRCNYAYITKICSAYNADTYFPNLDRDREWKLFTRGEIHEYENLKYYFCSYTRIRE